MALRAKAEFEAWKERKAEREGGIGDDGDGHGTRHWEPRSRSVARPGAVEGIAHSEGYNPRNSVHPIDSNGPSPALLTTPQEAEHNPYYPYGYPYFDQYNPDLTMSYQTGHYDSNMGYPYVIPDMWEQCGHQYPGFWRGIDDPSTLVGTQEQQNVTEQMDQEFATDPRVV